MISRGLSAHTEVVLLDKSIRPPLLRGMIGPIGGFTRLADLPPFLGDKMLTEGELRDFVQANVRVVNRIMSRLFYQTAVVTSFDIKDNNSCLRWFHP